MTIPAIFDKALRARRRDRAASGFDAHAFLYAAAAEEMLDRLADVSRPFTDALVIGAPTALLPDALRARGLTVQVGDPGALFAATRGGAVVDEDAPLPFAPASADLILCCGMLDSVNDVPGFLVQLRAILKPDGLLLLAFVGAGSLGLLRGALLAADGDRPAQRIHPQIDVRSAGDLLSRAGFAMPVADVQSLRVGYDGLLGLMADLRGMGGAQCLLSRPPALTRGGLMRAIAHFAGQADPDGRVRERFEIVHMSGWCPDPSQPAPARRGSATVSLAEALKPKPD
ncbi:class I SAM-dependent methyltransferase [Sphingobium sufflavum]|uniref:methyltransferase domain-containing protein n=1 Tax=Sphingobium sufflavum TaxID=1129547 RepID=UPI001F354634|nr:methyltransferase domain-containing protein [Sphingobium sufflavum]MCE7797274.1 class I SAM-dependent methyltransferase [Sphingobium sufflavum]